MGFFVPSVNTVIEDDVRWVLPMCVGSHTARVSLGRGTAEDLASLHSQALVAAAGLLDAGVGTVVFACTAGSMAGGPDYDRSFASDIRRTGAERALTTAGTIVAALEVLSARRITLFTPHAGPLHELEVGFFEAAGLQIVRSHRLDLGHPNTLAAVPPNVLATEVARLMPFGCDGGDAAVLSCANMRALEAVPSLEAHHGMPFIASNQAMLCSVINGLGLVPDERLGRLGKLQPV